LEGVENVEHYFRESALEQYRDVIAKHFQENPPASAKEAAAEIYKLTKLQRGETQTKVFLHKMGLKPRKTAALPAKANIEARDEFKKKFGVKARRSEERKNTNVFFRRRTFYTWGLPLRSMVISANICEGKFGEKSFERSWSN
jgi:transposase